MSPRVFDSVWRTWRDGHEDDGAPMSRTFAEWYRQTQPGLLESVLRAVQRRAVAEDAVDEAFEKAFARWERVQSVRSPNGWV